MPLTNFPHGFAHGLSLFGGFIPMVTRPGRTLFVDGVNGNNGRPGTSPDTSFATLQTAIDTAVDGEGTVIYVFPGPYPESLTINKRDIAIIGVSGRHPGRTQITGAASSTQATVLVDDGFARGFVLANIEVDTNSVARPAIQIVTNDTADLTATSSDEWWMLHNVRVNSGNTTLPSAALLLRGAQMGLVSDCLLANCTIGLALSGSLSNNIEDVYFYNTRFQDNVTADITTVNGMSTNTAFTAGYTLSQVTNLHFYGNRYLDRGGTPVTNYVNAAITTAVNCTDFGFYAARDVADGTLMQLPADWVAIGWSAAAAEFIIGA